MHLELLLFYPFVLGLEDKKNIDMTNNCSPPTPDVPSRGKSSFSPWLRPLRNLDDKRGFPFNVPSPEKEISPRSNFLQRLNAGHQDTNFVNSLCKGVNLNSIIMHDYKKKLFLSK